MSQARHRPRPRRTRSGGRRRPARSAAPPVRNTRLSLVARNALRPLRGDANATDIEKQVDAGKELARNWRMRRDVRDSYVTASRSVEESIGASSLVPGPWIPGARDNGQRTKDYTETFACLERALLRSIEETLQGGATPELLDMATARQSCFWSEVTPTIQAHWAMLAAVAQVLLEADRVAQALKKSKGGARAYFHGGLSPQELIIPVMVMTTTAQALSNPPTGIQWTLTTGSKKLSTRFFSVQISGQIGGLLVLELPRVRVEVRAKGKYVSVPVSASCIGEKNGKACHREAPCHSEAAQIRPPRGVHESHFLFLCCVLG